MVKTTDKLLSFTVIAVILTVFVSIFLNTVRELFAIFTFTFAVLLGLILPIIFSIMLFKKLRDSLK